MTNTTNLNLPFILPAQAQKHVTHNEALMALDALVQLSVIDNTLSSPPQNPLEGNRYIIASAPTGDWIGKENQITAWQDGAWVFFAPQTGWVSWAQNQDALYAYDGTVWIAASSGGGGGGGGGGVSLTDLDDGTVTTMGVNADADTTNRLSVNSAAVLFNREVDDVQVKLNKQSSTDTASFLYQTNFSGRAEMGTMGDDDFHFKVSGDGVTWKEGLIIDADTGEVSFPNTTFAGGGSKGDKGDTGATGAKGDKGDQGDGLQVDEIGDTAGRSTYDTETEGFIYLDNEANLLYRKNSNTSGDWSAGAIFGGENGVNLKYEHEATVGTTIQQAGYAEFINSKYTTVEGAAFDQKVRLLVEEEYVDATSRGAVKLKFKRNAKNIGNGNIFYDLFSYESEPNAGAVNSIYIRNILESGWGGKITCDYIGRFQFTKLDGTGGAIATGSIYKPGANSDYANFYPNGSGAIIACHFNGKVTIAPGIPTYIDANNPGNYGNETLEILMRTEIRNPTASNVPSKVIQADGQSANSFELRSYANSLLFALDHEGKLSKVKFADAPELPKYSRTALPAGVEAQMIYVTDATGGAGPAYCDGTNWKMMRNDGTP